MALVSDTVTEGQLYDYANTQIGERLSILPGLSQVRVYGTRSAVRTKADPSAMAIRSITLEDLTTAIKKTEPPIPVQASLTALTAAFCFSHKDNPPPPKEYNRLIVGQGSGSPVYLKSPAARQSV